MSLYLLSIEPIILKSKSVYFCFNIVAAFAQYINPFLTGSLPTQIILCFIGR